MAEKTGKLIVLSGPSGVGKGTICSKLLAEAPELWYSVSVTTRAPRPGEKHGVNYYFTDAEGFKKMRRAKGFLEWARLFGNYYGTPAAVVDEHLQAGQSVLLEIDTQGALQVLEKRPDCVSLFILPPSLEELHRRIRGRATEDEKTVRLRMSVAEKEIDMAPLYKYSVVNDEVDRAVAEIKEILRGEGILAAE